MQKALSTRDFGFWAVEAPGVCGSGWRLAADYWGRGYASEAVLAALRHAFTTAGLEEVVSFTVRANRRSVAVMERIGMTSSSEDDFDRLNLPEGHSLRRCVLYRMSKRDWARREQLEP